MTIHVWDAMLMHTVLRKPTWHYLMLLMSQPTYIQTFSGTTWLPFNSFKRKYTLKFTNIALQMQPDMHEESLLPECAALFIKCDHHTNWIGRIDSFEKSIHTYQCVKWNLILDDVTINGLFLYCYIFIIQMSQVW